MGQLINLFILLCVVGGTIGLLALSVQREINQKREQEAIANKTLGDPSIPGE